MKRGKKVHILTHLADITSRYEASLRTSKQKKCTYTDAFGGPQIADAMYIAYGASLEIETLGGTQFTCFTSTTVHILTPPRVAERGGSLYSEVLSLLALL